MVALTNIEILDELKKLGICSPAELTSYCCEYENYFSEYLKRSSF